METVTTDRCYGCGKEIGYYATGSGLRSDGGISIGLPGTLCADCAPKVAERVANPPGLVRVPEITEKAAAEALDAGDFVRPTEDAALFFAKLFPRSAAVLSAAGNFMHASGLKKTAHLFYSDRLEQTDDPAFMKLNYAAICQMDGNPERGLELMKQVPASTPLYTIIMGNLLKDVGLWDRAAENWRQAMTLHPRHPVAYMNLGFYLAQVLGDYPAAEDHFRRCCAAFPENRQFRAYLGDSLFFQDRKADALRTYLEAQGLPRSGRDADAFEMSLNAMIEECRKALPE